MGKSTNRRLFFQRAALAAAIAGGPRLDAARPAQEESRKEPLRIGFIGLGRRGFELFRAAREIPGVVVNAVCDFWGDKLERVRALGVEAFYTWLPGKVLMNTEIIVVAVPNHLHKPVCLTGLSYKRDLYLETPFTHQIEDAGEIAAALKDTGAILQAGNQQFSSPINSKVRELISSGALGQLTFIRAEAHSNTPVQAGYEDIPKNTDMEEVRWNWFLDALPSRPYDPRRFFQWKLYPDYCGGPATQEAVCLVAAIHAVTGATVPARVTAHGSILRWKEHREVPDHVSAVLEYPEGFVVSLTVTYNNDLPSPPLVFMGTEGSLEYYPNRCRLIPRSGDPEEFQAEGDATRLHLEAFLASVRSRRPPATDLIVGVQVANVGHMINLACRTGRSVGWDREAGKLVQT
jgi:predicted dehydrogenase